MARRHFATPPTPPVISGTVVVKTTAGALADISATSNGSAISGATLTVANKTVPEFYGPPDGSGDLLLTMTSHGQDWHVLVHASDADPAATPTAASAVTYDHTASGLAATNVKAALDELAASVAALQAP